MSWFPKDFVAVFKENDFLDDGTDRAHRIYFPLFLVAASAVLGLQQFAGDPIECFTQDSMARSQIDYVKSYCWTASTYQIVETDYNIFRWSKGTDHLLPGAKFSPQTEAESHMSGEKKFVSYYQWVPIIIAIQAMFFHVPYVLWWTFNKRGGIHLPHLMYGAYCLAKVQTNPIGRKTQRDDAAYLIDMYLQDNIRSPAPAGIRGLVPRKMQLTLLYFFVKLLYIANVIFQLTCLHSFLQTNILQYGFDVVKTLFLGQEWLTSIRFPLRTICEFHGLPQVNGYLLPHTCHCVLPINLYNDKFFAVMVVLMLCLLFMTLFSIVVWGLRLFLGSMRYNLISELIHEKDANRLSGFTNQYLRSDGLFILNLMYKNVGSSTAKEIAKELFDKYKETMGSDSSSEDSCEKQPLSPNGGNPKPLRCHNCGNPWSAREEGSTCSKCKIILKSQTPV